MKKTTLALCHSTRAFDFKVGRLALSKHLALGDVCVLSVDPKRYSRQLLLRQPSDLSSGRVPLYVCALCADLGCGALTVSVSRTDEGMVWQDFAVEGAGGGGSRHATEIMARLGPFLFEEEAYRFLFHPFLR